MRVASLCCAFLFVGCHGTRPPVEVMAPDARMLAGSWNLELRQSSVLPFKGVPALGEPAPFVFGELSLAPLVDSTSGGASRREILSGIFTGTIAQNTGEPVVEFGVIARIQSDRRVAVTLTFPGPCPCQTMELVGSYVDGEVDGRFTHAVGKMVSGGRFRLRRP